jgi:hypothetical protein
MPSKLQSILIGALFAAVIGTLLTVVQQMGDMATQQMMGTVIGCITCIVYILAGLVAVWHYTSTYSLTLEGGQGAVMGLSAGALGAVIAILLGLILRAVGLLPTVAESIAMMEQSGMFDEMPPEQAEMTMSMVETMSGVLGWGIALLMGVIAGAIGGAIGAAVFKKGPETEAY